MMIFRKNNLKSQIAVTDELRKFTNDELQAVRKRLDRMQEELDTALELAKQQTNLANTALSQVNEQNAQRHKELVNWLETKWSIIKSEIDERKMRQSENKEA